MGESFSHVASGQLLQVGSVTSSCGRLLLCHQTHLLQFRFKQTLSEGRKFLTLYIVYWFLHIVAEHHRKWLGAPIWDGGIPEWGH